MHFFGKSRRVRGGNRKTKKTKRTKKKVVDYDSDPGEPELLPKKKRRTTVPPAHRVLENYLKKETEFLTRKPVIVIEVSSDDESEPELMPRKKSTSFSSS
jgi:hypothetical protein